MKLWVVRGAIDPHFVDDLEPAVSESTQGISMAAILFAVVLIIELSPDTAGQTLFSKKVEGVAKVFVTSPALVNAAVFSGTSGYWSRATKAL